MRFNRSFGAALILALGLPLGAIAAGGYGMHRAHARHFFQHDDRGGVVYVMSNNSARNSILVYSRDFRGRLKAIPQATALTGGRGGADNAAIDRLGSQGALVYDKGTCCTCSTRAAAARWPPSRSARTGSSTWSAPTI